MRGLRREKGLSLRDLGRATGFSISFLSLVERGRSWLSLASLHAIAVALGIEMSTFFRRRQPELPPPQVDRRCQDARVPIRGAHAGEEFAYVLSGELVSRWTT